MNVLPLTWQYCVSERVSSWWQIPGPPWSASSWHVDGRAAVCCWSKIHKKCSILCGNKVKADVRSSGSDIVIQKCLTLEQEIELVRHKISKYIHYAIHKLLTEFKEFTYMNRSPRKRHSPVRPFYAAPVTYERRSRRLSAAAWWKGPPSGWADTSAGTPSTNSPCNVYPTTILKI